MTMTRAKTKTNIKLDTKDAKARRKLARKGGNVLALSPPNGEKYFPPKFKDPAKLRERINAYFDYCAEVERHPTITGLALWLGTNRQTLFNYKNEVTALKSLSPEVRQEMADIIREAHVRCEEHLAQMGLSRKTHPAVTIFCLKQHGWADERSIRHSGRIEGGAADVLAKIEAAREEIEKSGEEEP